MCNSSMESVSTISDKLYLTQTTDSFMVNISNISFISELESNNTGNQTSTGGNSTESQVSFILASVVCLVGATGNFATLLLFLVQKKVQIPSYTGICCSSVADLTALISRYLIFVSIIMVPKMAIDYKYLFGISALTHMSSNFHVLIIAIIRYIYISKPFYSLTFSYSKVLYMSLCAWIASFAMGVPYTVQLYFVEKKIMSNFEGGIVEIVMTCVPFGTTFVPIIVLHFLNIANLRKGLSKSKISVSKTMSKVLAAIICIYLLTNTPGVIMSILDLCDIHIQLTWFGQICWILSYASNPFVFLICSKTSRTLFAYAFTCRCFRNET